jgi:hypothetical protein
MLQGDGEAGTDAAALDVEESDDVVPRSPIP